VDGDHALIDNLRHSIYDESFQLLTAIEITTPSDYEFIVYAHFNTMSRLFYDQ
jgi:hypothetical protein